MTIQKILIWPDRRLLQCSQEVKKGEELDSLVEDMLDTMEAAKGLGLAAIQIGVPKRVIVFKVGTKLLALANPEIVVRQNKTEFKGEGCLSLPGEVFNTERYSKITLRAYPISDLNTFFDCNLDDLEAVEVQHEIDHLDGKLLVMRPEVGIMRRDIIRRRMIKYKRALNYDSH